MRLGDKVIPEPPLPEIGTRLCAEPTAIGLVRAGDVVIYQTEGMRAEAEGVVESTDGFRAVLASGMELCAGDYIVVQGDVSGREMIVPDLSQVFPSEAPRRLQKRAASRRKWLPDGAKRWVEAVIAGIDGKKLDVLAAVGEANLALGMDLASTHYQTYRRRFELAPKTTFRELIARSRSYPEPKKRALVIAANRLVDIEGATIKEALAQVAADGGMRINHKVYATWRKELGLPLRDRAGDQA